MAGVLSIIRCNKNEKKKLCVNFSMSAGPFKQTGLGGGHQAAFSYCQQQVFIVFTPV
jgi:hypothetical protein